jgi:hypothetical protein
MGFCLLIITRPLEQIVIDVCKSTIISSFLALSKKPTLASGLNYIFIAGSLPKVPGNALPFQTRHGLLAN